MTNVPAKPLEKVIADRLIQLSQQDCTVERLVQTAMADTSELLGNLTTRRTALNTNRRRILDQIDALVGGIAERRTALKSVSKKIAEIGRAERATRRRNPASGPGGRDHKEKRPSALSH